MRTSGLFGAKNFGFFEIGVSTLTRGRRSSQYGHFTNKGKVGVKFSRFSTGVFYGRP